jgi:glycosyltransferase involved in cell wall biosynthesis
MNTLAADAYCATGAFRSADTDPDWRPRILFLSAMLPYVPRKSVFGGFQRLGRHLRALDRLGSLELVLFAPPEDPCSPETVAAIADAVKKLWSLRGPVHVIRADKTSNLLERVREICSALQGVVRLGGDRPNLTTWRQHQIDSLERILQSAQPDLVFAHQINGAVPLLRVKSRLPPLVVDLDDVASIRLARLARAAADRAERWEACLGEFVARRAQRRLAAIADAQLVCSEVERHQVQLMSPGRRVFTIPNCARSFAGLPNPTEPTALFIGTARHPPNREAFLWFANEVWPLVRSAVPAARFVAVGDGTDEIGIRSEQLGIEALGFVDDLQPIYAAASLAVCPVHRGSGTRIKIIEAASSGRPIVSTTLGAEGLEFCSDTEIIVADDIAGFAEACIGLFRDPDRAVRIGQAAMRRALSTYRTEEVTERLCAVCRYVLGRTELAGAGSAQGTLAL